MTALPYTDADLDVMARTVWGEARGEPFMGKLAICYVIRNRAEHPRWWGHTIAEVCRKPQQFSCWNADDPNAAKCAAVTPDDLAFVDCLAASRAALEGLQGDPTRGADHYHVAGLHPAWAKDFDPTAYVGAHVFYKLRD